MLTKKRVVIVAVILFLVGGGATLYAKNAANTGVSGGQAGTVKKQAAAAPKKPTLASSAGSTTTASTAPGDLPKQDNSGNYNPGVTGGGGAAPQVPTDTTGLSGLSATITAETASSEASAISVYAYLSTPGWYTVQEKSSGQWQTTKQNVYYQGTGGLEAGDLAADRDSITLRLLKIDNGQYSAVSQEVTVSRADVVAAGGIKTFHI